MPLPNSLNTAKGDYFEKIAASVLQKHFGVVFQTKYSVLIGNPPKAHKFDLASNDLKYIGECKNYSWTESGNIPSAKMGFVNEAVFYLQHITHDTNRFVVLRKDIHQKRGETIAEYYFRTNKHLLNGVFVIEIDTTGEVREFRV